MHGALAFLILVTSWFGGFLMGLGMGIEAGEGRPNRLVRAVAVLLGHDDEEDAKEVE